MCQNRQVKFALHLLPRCPLDICCGVRGAAYGLSTLGVRVLNDEYSSLVSAHYRLDCAVLRPRQHSI